MSQEISDRILRPAAAAKMLGVGRNALYRWAKEGKLPPKVRMSSRAGGWLESDLRKFIAQCQRPYGGRTAEAVQ